ncbi:Adaptin ear-binding coat-associated protein 1 [Sarcoptes scabiei]|nr:Adaptin ear-binding coat-associated protein 1 [Sarcoptes scabiei]
MARKADKTIKICMICGDKAKGVNFNVLTCMSCKAFFRRNALRKNDMKCPFNDTCQIDKITRKFCSKCRLKKCFDCGMKKVSLYIEEILIFRSNFDYYTAEMDFWKKKLNFSVTKRIDLI